MTRLSRGSWAIARPLLSGAAVVIAVLTAVSAPGLAASKEDKVFTVGNYPVEARAADAVAAKERAIAEGQQAAFRSLLKRLVPVTAYKHLAALKTTPAATMIESLAVRSERNSSTEYIASYDFVFSAEPVRRLLDARNIPYLDRQAPQITIVPVYRVPAEMGAALPKTFAAAAGSDAWLYAWKALDLANSLTPAAIMPPKREVHADTIKALADGNLELIRTLAAEYQTETVIAAVLEPEADQKHLKVVLAGRDAVQQLYLKRKYRLEGFDMAYTAELAAVVSHAILEGRWKAINVRGESANSGHPGVQSMASPAYGRQTESPTSPGSGPGSGGVGGPMTIAVQFNGMGEWQAISRQLSAMPEISGLEVLGLSARGARVSLTYPGDMQDLAQVLAQQGLILENTRGGWIFGSPAMNRDRPKQIFASGARDMKSIVGTWALVRATSTATDDTMMPPPYGGEKGMGRVTFNADGRMMAVLCDGRPAIPGGLAREYNSYCGNYKFDGKQLVTRVDAASDPIRVDTDQVRDVRFEDNLMVLRPPLRSDRAKPEQRELYWEKIADV